MKFQDLKNGRFYWEDCFDVMKTIPDSCIEKDEVYANKAIERIKNHAT